jgi:putative transposase
MNEQSELRIRRRALRLWATGHSVKDLLRRIHRSKGWLSKWRTRYRLGGWEALHSHSRRPHHQPTAWSARWEQLIVQTRLRLKRAKIGLSGPTAIRRELQKLDRHHRVPSCTTIKRILHRHGLLHPPKRKRTYFPVPLQQLEAILHASDWTCRYLEAGTKVYAFHTLNLQTRSCSLTLARDKTIATVRTHFLETWQTLGIPDYLQLDNDAAFCGGYKVARVFGQIVRLCLYVGIEIIFLPVAEPERNGAVEQLNQLWQRAAWNRSHFPTFAAVQRTGPKFLHWYMHDYFPPALDGQTPHQAQRTQARHCLTRWQASHLPHDLPITTGQIHFVRHVPADGTITILNETWRVGRRYAGKYVWATIQTRAQRLDIWYQPSLHTEWRILRSYSYRIPEPVARRNCDLFSS